MSLCTHRRSSFRGWPLLQTLTASLNTTRGLQNPSIIRLQRHTARPTRHIRRRPQSLVCRPRSCASPARRQSATASCLAAIIPCAHPAPKPCTPRNACTATHLSQQSNCAASLPCKSGWLDRQRLAAVHQDQLLEGGELPWCWEGPASGEEELVPLVSPACN